MSIYLSICLSVCLSVCLCVYLPLCLHWFIHLSIYSSLSLYLYVYHISIYPWFSGALQRNSSSCQLSFFVWIWTFAESISSPQSIPVKHLSCFTPQNPAIEPWPLRSRSVSLWSASHRPPCSPSRCRASPAGPETCHPNNHPYHPNDQNIDPGA